MKKNHSDSVVSAGYEDPVDSVLPSAAEKKPTLVQPARVFIQNFPQCIDTNSYSEPVNAICQPSAGKSITVHASRKAKKPLTPPSVYTRINPSTREPCSQYMTTAIAHLDQQLHIAMILTTLSYYQQQDSKILLGTSTHQ